MTDERKLRMFLMRSAHLNGRHRYEVEHHGTRADPALMVVVLICAVVVFGVVLL